MGEPAFGCVLLRLDATLDMGTPPWNGSVLRARNAAHRSLLLRSVSCVSGSVN